MHEPECSAMQIAADESRKRDADRWRSLEKEFHDAKGFKKHFKVKSFERIFKHLEENQDFSFESFQNWKA